MGLCLIGLLLLEVFIFNLPTWQTLRTSPESANLSSLKTVGLKESGDGVTALVPNPTVNITLDRVIKYIYLEVPAQFQNTSQHLSYTVGVSYKGDRYVHYGAAQTLDLGVRDNRYINAGSYVENVTLKLNVPKGTFLPITKIIINPHIPYRISILRLLMLLLLISFWVLFGPGSILWEMELNTRAAFQIVLLGLATLGVLFFYFVTWYFNGNSYSWTEVIRNPSGIWVDYNQYGTLADALLHGHTWLNLSVSPGLKALKNPYSLAAREAIGSHGQFSFWDHAFYHGKYYCYFGVIPAIIFFMPYEAITGKYLPSGWAILIALIIAIIFSTFLIIRIAKLYFQDSSIATTLLGIWMLGMGCGLLQEAFVADFYSVPEATSFMFSILGLWCWLKAIKISKKRGRKIISPWWIFFGSLFMACNLGCRPQYLSFAFLAIPIFWSSVFKDRLLFSKKGIWPTVFGLLPFFLIFIPLFIYNFDRFGSCLNFGENYNLTIFDMVRVNRPRLTSTILLMLSYFWFQPLNIVGIFPFITTVRMSPIGPVIPFWYSMDPAVGGGYFTFNAPFTFVLLALTPWIFARSRRRILDKTFSDRYSSVRSVRGSVISLILLSVAFGVIVTYLDASWCGFSQRYESCFGSLFTLSAVFVLFSIFPVWLCREKERHHGVMFLKILLVFLLTMTCIWEFLGLCDLGRLSQNATSHIFKVASWFLFMS